MTKSFGKNLRILVTDGHDSAALGLIRAFGRAGHQVIAAHVAGDRPPPCLSSRHCSGRRIQPDARTHPARFCSWLADRVREDGLHAIVPTSAAAIVACATLRSELPASLLLLAATGNGQCPGHSDWFRNAENAGVRTPRTWMPNESGGWSEHGSGEVLETDALQFPVVLRATSRTDSAQPCCPGRAYYCGRPGILSYVRDAVLRPYRDVFVQEYLAGESEYALLLRLRGELRMHFAFRSESEATPWGGRATSLVCMEDDGPVQDAAKLLAACDYEGLASVEYRRDANGRRCLVGLDRSPWCSAVAALCAGLDFPAAWLDSLQGGSVRTPKTPWRKGIRRVLVSSRFTDEPHSLPSGEPGERAPPGLTRLCDLRKPLIQSKQFWWSDPAPRVASMAALIALNARRVLTPMIHGPSRSRLLAQAVALAERARSLLVLAAERRDLEQQEAPVFVDKMAAETDIVFALDQPSCERTAAAAKAAYAKCALLASRRRPVYPLRIFMFHAVIDQPLEVPHYCFVEHSLFRRQLELIRQHYQVLPLAEAVQRLRAGELRAPSSVITFDDGFENNFTHAFPELQRLELPASVFVATGFTGSQQTAWFCRVLRAVAETRARTLAWKGQRYDVSGSRAKLLTATDLMVQLKRQPPDVLEADLGCIEALLGFEARRPVESGSPFRMLGAPAIKEMAASGLVDFGGHTTNHAILSRLSSDGQRREIEDSLNSLGRILDKPCQLFAYPNGQADDFDEHSIECLRDSGVSVALTAIPGVNPWFGDPFELYRESVGPPDMVERFEARIERMVQIDRLLASATP